MPNFFADSVQNNNTCFAHTLEDWGNSWLQSFASFAGGKKYVRIGKENHWNDAHSARVDDYRIKQMKKTALGIVFLVPGIFLGSLCKAIALLNSEVRARNYAVHVVNSVTAEHTTPYHEVTRRIANRAALETKIAACDVRAICDLKTALDEGNWAAEIFNDQNFPYYALRLLKENQITQEQFGSVQLFWNAKKTYGSQLQIIPLFIDDAVNEDAKSKIEKTLVLHSSHASRQAFSFRPCRQLFKTENIDCYFELMKKQPKSEQSFFFIDHDDGPDWDTNEQGWQYYDSHTISQEVLFSTGINALGRVENGRMIAPVAMMQQFLETFSCGDVVKISPVIGLSHLKDIRENGKNDTRDMAVAFPGITLPKRADGYKAPGVDFSWHDFYHAIIASCMRKEDRYQMIRVADAIDELRKKSWYGRYDLTLLRNRFIDMEFSRYRRDSITNEMLSQELLQSPYGKEAFLWYVIASTELDYLPEESVWWHFFVPWRFNKSAYRQKIITDLNPTKKAVQLARDSLEIFKNTHPINAYL